VTDRGDGVGGHTPRESVTLDPVEAMRLLASVSYGRVVFTQEALPAIGPVNHLLDDGRVIIRTRLTASIASAASSCGEG
jgi:hypothetical protein